MITGVDQQATPTSNMTVPAAPLSPYGTLTGQIFLYAGNRVAFESSLPIFTPPSAADDDDEGALACSYRPNKCILIGGLSDGLLPVPYTSKLDEIVVRHTDSWSLVQPILTSSYLGFGHGSLQRDTEELNELMAYLIEHRNGERFCIIGHSTGCQNIVHFLKYGDPDYTNAVCAAILQAPVSDREDAMQHESYAVNIELAKQMRKEGKQDEMMPRNTFWAPITAARLLDLQEYGGADDYFSSDLTDDELRQRLGHVGNSKRKVIVAFSGSDEYVPSHVDKPQLTSRLVKAMGSSTTESVEALFLPDGNHNLSECHEDRKTFLARVSELLQYNP